MSPEKDRDDKTGEQDGACQRELETGTENGDVPPEGIVFVEDEISALFHEGQRHLGKTNALDKIISDWLASGRKVEMIDVKADPELARMLAAKREEIERDLPGWSAGPRWGRVKLTPSEIAYPVRVGDVVRIIDTMWGDRPVPGHVVDIDDWWVYVSGPLGRKIPFYGQTGYLAGEYRWRLEPYITEEENNR